MISLKKYLDSSDPALKIHPEGKTLFPLAISAYRSALMEIGSCSHDACPALGNELKQGMQQIEESLGGEVAGETIQKSQTDVHDRLQSWGRRTALHYQQKTNEVKEILLVMARTAESVGERDQRCAQQLSDVTTNLRTIASLDDLTQMRRSIEKSAVELKTSIDRMTAEGKAAMDSLRAQVTTYQTRLEEAEQIASSDSLTGLRSRMCVEEHIERRIANASPFCVAIIDIDRFKQVNDEHGHIVGDELLQQFSTELKSACRSTDIVGRWGGDEFIVLMDCGMDEALGQSERLTKWICGSYTLQEKSTPIKLNVEASIGLAEHLADESIKDMLARADAQMYEHKAASKTARGK